MSAKGTSVREWHCECESSACEGIHAGGMCKADITGDSPEMMYLGHVCYECADRIIAAGGGHFITRYPERTKVTG